MSRWPDRSVALEALTEEDVYDDGGSPKMGFRDPNGRHAARSAQNVYYEAADAAGDSIYAVAEEEIEEVSLQQPRRPPRPFSPLSRLRPPTLPAKREEQLYSVPTNRPVEVPSSLKLSPCLKAMLGQEKVSYRTLWIVTTAGLICIFALAIASVYFFHDAQREEAKFQDFMTVHKFNETARDEFGMEGCFIMPVCKRRSCGPQDVTRDECVRRRGCCYQAEMKGVPTCFYSSNHVCNLVKPKNRRSCQKNSPELEKNRALCETTEGCCFDDSVAAPSVVRCFKQPLDDFEWRVGCGRRRVYQTPPPLDDAGRVVGGQTARNGAFPWIAQITHKSNTLGSQTTHCGGTVIADDWILTAAHCFDLQRDPRFYKVFVGETDVERLSGFEQELEVLEVVPHDGYKLKATDTRHGQKIQYHNDIALLRVTPLKRTFYVQPACLPPTPSALIIDGAGEDLYAPGSHGVVAGWGFTSNDAGKGTPKLQAASIPLVNNSLCQKWVNELGGESLSIQDDDVCAAYPEGGVDTCRGDSGGPLLIERQQKFIVVGLTSFGYHCAAAKMPGVYTRVQNHLGWIYSVIENV